MNESNFLCPDCESNRMTQSQKEKHGICVSCMRRKNIAKAANHPYYKFKDLTEQEKNNILNKRKNKIKEVNSNTKETKTRKSIYSDELIEFIKYNEDKTLDELLALVANQFPEYQFTKPKFKSFMSFKNLNFRRVGRGRKAYKEQLQNKDLQEIFSTDQIRFILRKCVEGENYNEIYKSFYLEFNEGPFISITIFINILKNNYIYSNDYCNLLKAEYSSNEYNIYMSKFNEQLKQFNITFTIFNEQKTESTESVQQNEENYLKPIELNINNKVNNSIEEEYSFEELQPIFCEVETVLNKKAKQCNCFLDKHYSLDQYLDALNMLQYFICNFEKIIKYNTDQVGIANAYQIDIDHEGEFRKPKKGDSYIDIKLHALRNIRRDRYAERDMLSFTKFFINRINPASLDKAIENLQKLKDQRTNMLYIPQVDDTLIEKYEWAVASDANTDPSRSKYGYELTNTFMPSEKTKSARTIGFDTYRVSCKLSGGGYGVFSNWHRDYKAINQDQALEYGNNDLDIIKNQTSGLLITDLKVIKMNK